MKTLENDLKSLSSSAFYCSRRTKIFAEGRDKCEFQDGQSIEFISLQMLFKHQNIKNVIGTIMFKRLHKF